MTATIEVERTMTTEEDKKQPESSNLENRLSKSESHGVTRSRAHVT